MPSQQLPPETLIKAKNVAIILSIAMTFLLVLYAFYLQIVNSKNLLVIVAQVIIILLFILYRRTLDQTPHAPLFSFPSLSMQTQARLFSFPSLSLHESQLANKNVSWQEPETIVEQRSLEKDDAYTDDRAISEWGSFGRRETFERALIVSGQEEVIKMVVHEQPQEDQGLNDESMDDTWRAIVAKGKAKPVSLRNTFVEKAVEIKESQKRKEKKKKKKKKELKLELEGETSQSLGQERNGWRRQRDVIMMPNDELSRLSEILIKKQYNRLKIERQQSDQRRLISV